MFSLHTQLTRDSAPDARYKKLPFEFRRVLGLRAGGMLYSGPWLELLGSGQFNGVQWK